MEGEDDVLYGRFLDYLDIAKRYRSVTGAYVHARRRAGQETDHIKQAPKNWYIDAEVWKWKERATAYDDWDAEERLYDIEQLKEAYKKTRLDIQEEARDTILRFLHAADPNRHEVSVHHLAQAVVALNKDLRAEFAEEDSKKKANDGNTFNFQVLINQAIQQSDESPGDAVDTFARLIEDSQDTSQPDADDAPATFRMLPQQTDPETIAKNSELPNPKRKTKILKKRKPVAKPKILRKPDPA
jgi:hypothetical protein